MICLIWPNSDRYVPCKPITLEIGEVEDFDFSESAGHIFRILQVLELSNLIEKVPYANPVEIIYVIQELLYDIDFTSDKLQISETKHVRIEFRDEMLSLEVYVGV